MRNIAPLLILAAWALIPGCAGDDSYPNRPILLICPWAAGGGTDAVSRQISIYLEKELGVPVNVINATGGAGVTGHGRGARARPDGYTLLMMTVEINMLHWRGLTGLTWKNYQPLLLVNRDRAAVFVRADSPWKDLASLTRAAREEPGKLKASGTAIGGIWHLALAGWLTAEGMKPDAITWVPYGGAGPSLTELVSSGLDVVCCSVPEARTYLENKTVRCLGVMSKTPVKGHDDIPTFESLGIHWTMGGWRGLALPTGAPPEVMNRLVPVLKRIASGETEVEGRTFPQFMEARGFDASWELPREFCKTLETTDRSLGKLITSPEFAGLREERVPAMGFPAILISLLVIVLALMGAGRLLKGGRERPFRLGGWIRAAEVAAGVVLYLLLAESLGFILTAGGILFVLLLRLGNRPWLGGMISGVLVPVIYLLFAVLLRVPLPRGDIGLNPTACMLMVFIPGLAGWICHLMTGNDGQGGEDSPR